MDKISELVKEATSLKHKCIKRLAEERDALQAQLDEVRPTLGSTKVIIVDEPPRVPEKCHWDFLLAEVVWLREDIVSERKWKKGQWKKLGKEALKHKYIVDRDSGVDLVEQQLLKTSAFLAHEVEKFWKGIHQLALHRVGKVHSELKRVDNQKRLDELVHRTELLVQDEASIVGTPSDESSKRVRLTSGGSHALLDSITAEMTRAQPMGNSFATMGITVPVPSLFRGHMREYQHIGMQWLSTLHDRGLNGILADEMGLGKTIQTIALLGHLACDKGIWGPHLIVVPTSVMLNWEIEFKKFLPGFKILTYFGTPKERREKRIGWTQPNAFHVCIVSYTLVLTDAAVFRKKKWHYLILDEAHQIKNFKSQRWQNLLTFKTERRLLLTGTPLQNDLIELWSLLHFLMPTIFTSHSEFQEWFAEPLSKAIENSNLDSHRNLISRLHALIRPFLLRRLKREVEKQMPSKYEHVIPVELSRRQKSLYDEFILHRDNKNSTYVGLMNVLMQLRKICNHPDLIAQRDVKSPFVMKIFEKKYFPKICYLEQPLGSFNLARHEFDRPKWTNPIERCETENSFSSLFSKFHFPIDKECRYSQHAYFSKLTKKIISNPPSCLWADWPVRLGREAIELLQFVRQTSHPFFVRTGPQRLEQCREILRNFSAYTVPIVHTQKRGETVLASVCSQYWDLTHSVRMSRLCAFPDRRFLLWDSGKFSFLKNLLFRLRAGNHKVILFTQMSKMLDVIEAFANACGFSYVRLDGTTKVANRQFVVDKFNNDRRIFLFISSTRSGGVGINLTSADSVVFFDSDWNPAMDKQAMDRCHRIGQMRDVNIYRLVSEKTIEENIFSKQLQKRKLDEVVLDNRAHGSYDDATVRVEDLLAELDSPGSLDRSAIYGTHILWEREEDVKLDAGLTNLLAQVEDPEDRVKAKRTTESNEDSNYLLLPEVVRMCVDREVADLHQPDEWDELEAAEWDSQDDSDVV